MVSSIICSPTVGHIHIKIPPCYYRQPIISRLISRFNLTINIAAAFLESHTETEGWFHLEIQGVSQQLDACLAYLQELNIEVVQFDLKTPPQKNQEQFQLLCASNYSHAQIDDDNIADLTVLEGQTTRAKFQVCIPKNYHSYPVIAGLVACYGLTVNIIGAVLNTGNKNDGWFDLEIWGKRQQIVLGLRYLKELGLQIWL